LFEAIEWMAPGFEIVQSHLPNWKFQAADTVADGGLHARLVVGSQRPVREVAGSAAQLHELLARTQLSLLKNGALIEQGCGANVLDSPLMALQHFLTELRQCPGAPDLQAGDVITTGTWTDAWPAHPDEQWAMQFDDPTPTLSGTSSSPLPRLTLDLV
jgi:2-oxo-3-hexenedioate decarboxylase